MSLSRIGWSGSCREASCQVQRRQSPSPFVLESAGLPVAAFWLGPTPVTAPAPPSNLALDLPEIRPAGPHRQLHTPARPAHLHSIPGITPDCDRAVSVPLGSSTTGCGVCGSFDGIHSPASCRLRQPRCRRNQIQQPMMQRIGVHPVVPLRPARSHPVLPAHYEYRHVWCSSIPLATRLLQSSAPRPVI